MMAIKARRLMGIKLTTFIAQMGEGHHADDAFASVA
jgi:hypothetical protein